VNKKGKYKQEQMEASYKKQKEASDKVNKHTIYNATMFIGRIRPRRLHGVCVVQPLTNKQ